MQTNTSRPVLILDGMNAFIRCWAAFPTMSSHGYQMGGCIGFLKTLQRLVSEQRPKAVYVAWEGGGSQRRRKIFAEYKLGRRPEKLNRFYGDDIPDSEENRKHQVITLLSMLKCVPVFQVYVSDCEGDDIIAYLCKGPLVNENKVIVSSDKDFYQLLTQGVKIYSLHKKTFVTQPDILEEFRVTPDNFAIAKALCGDPSDNIPGVKGLGFKTIAKLYPMLGSDETVLLQDLLDYAQAHRDESKVHARVCEQQDDVRRNYKLVQLDGSMLSATQAARVDNVLGTFRPRANKMELIRLLVKEGIGDFDIENLFYAFNCVHSSEENER